MGGGYVCCNAVIAFPPVGVEFYSMPLPFLDFQSLITQNIFHYENL
jgi:hypothetical protein